MFNRLRGAIKDIRNYYYIKGVIRKNRNTPEWKKHNLSVGYFGVIYTVINLPPEVFESEEQYHSVYVMEMMMPINNYLASLNLQEVITPRVENLINKEKGEYAYGVKYLPLFRDLSLGYVMWRVLGVLLVLWLQLRFELFSKGLGYVFDYVKKFFEWAF